MLKSIFYARFHSERGPVVLRQYPLHGIFASPRNAAADGGAQLIQFSDISSYIIPPYELCNNALSIVSNGHCIAGWPVSIEDAKYPRNRFTFNVCFVLGEALEESERRAWNVIVRKTARWFRAIEECDALLSKTNEDNDVAQSTRQESEDVVSKVLEQVFCQLTEYSECCVPVSSTHVLNLRYVVQEASGEIDIHAWDVPLLIAELPDHEKITWDLVLQQIHHHIDGVNHIRRIADIADVELELVQDTVQALVKARLAMILDIFHFQAVYVPTADLAFFVKNKQLLAECQNYITRDGSNEVISVEGIVNLYLTLRPGLSIGSFCLAHPRILATIDVRRLITFGVVKGFVRRMHRYAQISEPMSTHELSRPVTSVRDDLEEAAKKLEHAWKQAALSSGWATPPTDKSPSLKTRAPKTEQQIRFEADEKLRTYLDGRHCFDAICVEMGMSETQVLEKLKAEMFSEVTMFMV